MDTEQIKALLARYQEGACTPAETQVVEQWFDNINSRRSHVMDEAALHTQLEEVKMQLQYMLPERAPRSYKTLIFSLCGIAASLLLGLVIFYKPATRKAFVAAAPTPVRIELPAHSSRVVDNGFMIITTGKGSTEQVALADGSTITVNASSRLRYPLQFPKDKRQVYLDEGEAYFKVATDPSRAFSVVSGKLITTALGTSFNIRNYQGEKRITVSLLSGKVKVEGASGQRDASILLLPSERLDYDCKNIAAQKNSFAKEEEIIGWKQGFLIFKDASFRQVQTEIENRYGVTVVNESNQQAWEYTGFFKDESLQELVETICLTKNITYKISNDTVYFRD